MTRKFISSGSEFEDKIRYSRAVVDGDYVFVSGTTGYNYETMSIPLTNFAIVSMLKVDRLEKD